MALQGEVTRIGENHLYATGPNPGKPLNPNEPNLEALIERAKPFNV
jgi:hypothetical protein